VKKIAITGPESTGKSSICEALQLHFGGVVVPEFAREFLSKKSNRYTFEDVEFMAREQLKREQSAFDAQHEFLFCDTDLLVMRIWMEHVFGKCPQWIIEESQGKHYDFTLLMDIDLPWEDDPLREHPHQREVLFQKYLEALEQSKRPFAIVRGNGEDRIQNAIQLIRDL
jgi:nicotinamide riboside kinase